MFIFLLSLLIFDSIIFGLVDFTALVDLFLNNLLMNHLILVLNLMTLRIFLKLTSLIICVTIS